MKTIPILERDIKSQVKDYLSIRGIFNFPLVQGMGAYKGVPDRVLHYKGQVVYLEIKRPGGKQSEYQKAFEAQCLADGISYWLITSVDELMEKMEEDKEP